MKVYKIDTTANTKVGVEIIPTARLLIKNFTDENIEVSFDDTNYTTIATNFYQNFSLDKGVINKVYIKPKAASTGGVELCVI